MKDLVKDTLKKIQERHIAPEPKWKHLLRKSSFWIVFVVIILLGSVSLAITSDLVSGLDWDLYPLMQRRRIDYALSVFPYLWAIIILIFLAAAFFGLRKTEKGYRYSAFVIAAISLGSIILLGTTFFFTGIGTGFHSALQKDFPAYSRHVTTKETQWMQPEQGFLAGMLFSVSQDDSTLRDLHGNNWSVLINEKTIVRPAVDMTQATMVKIIGKQSDKNTFQAIEIRPWRGKGEMAGRQRHHRQVDEKQEYIPFK